MNDNGYPETVSSSPPLSLRPMGLGEILDKSFRLYRQHFIKFFLIIFMVTAIKFLIVLAFQTSIEPDLATDPAGTMIFTIANAILSYILKIFYVGALTIAASETLLGREIGIGRSYRYMNRLFGKLLGANLLSMIIILIGFILLIIPGIYLYLGFCLLPMIVVIERIGGPAALRRSRRLMKHHLPGEKKKRSFRLKVSMSNYSRAFLIYLLVFVISGVLSAIIILPIQAVTVFKTIQQGGEPETTLRIIRALTTTIVEALVGPFSVCAFLFLYYDIRIRREGFDLELMAESLDSLKR